MNRIVMLLYVGAATVSVFARQGNADTPPLSGTLAYLHEGSVCVGSAAAPFTAAQIVPRSKGAILFSLSPSGDGTIVFFGDKSKARGHGGSGPPLCAYFSRPPYKDSDALPLYVGKDDDILVTWDASGDAEIAVGDLQTRRLEVKTGRLTVVTDPSIKSHDKPRRGGSASSTGGDMSVYTDGDNQVLMRRTVAGGPETMLFTPKSPDAMFAAVKRAKNPVNLKPLTDAIDASLWKDPRNWSISPPTLTSDKKTAFLASNLGTSMGAQGNTFFCLFAIDAITSKVAVLSKAGTFFGRVPTDICVSPDDDRLFMTTSAHASAADNSFSGYVIDLQTQQTREIIRSDPAHASDANLTGGWSWSPDGRFLAIAILYYNAKAIRDDREPNSNDATLYIKDAATGRIVEQIPHAQMPTWVK